MSSPALPHDAAAPALPMLTVDQVLACPDRVVIDLRTPEEYGADHLPGAINLPLFGELQRAMVGYLYRQVSPQDALEQGRRYAQERVQPLVDAIARIAEWKPHGGDLRELVGQLCAGGPGGSGGLESMEAFLEPLLLSQAPAAPVVLHCWRGGLRSRSVVALVRALGLQRAVGLCGGYKAYRHRVMEGLQTWKRPAPVVLHGLTGVGKTLVLREIEALDPGRTLDLEALAGHRSSLLGMVGLEPCGQKEFDSRLSQALETAPHGAWVVEGESRKVGDIVLPSGLWQAMGAGRPLWLHASMERRIAVLMDDYLGRSTHREPLRRQLASLSARLPQTVDWLGWFDGGREADLVRELLTQHYDPVYLRTAERHLGGEPEALGLPAIATECPQRAAREVLAWMDAHGLREGPVEQAPRTVSAPPSTPPSIPASKPPSGRKQHAFGHPRGPV